MDTFVATGSCAGDGIWKDPGTRPIDANGDGYADQIHSRTSNSWVNLNNTDKGWSSPASGWTPGPIFVRADYSDTGTRILDANGDGFPDLIRSGFESGYGHATSTELHKGTGQVDWEGTTSFTHLEPLFTDDVRFGDVDGDGLTDLIQGRSGTHKVFINRGDDTGGRRIPATLSRSNLPMLGVW